MASVEQERRAEPTTPSSLSSSILRRNQNGRRCEMSSVDVRTCRLWVCAASYHGSTKVAHGLWEQPRNDGECLTLSALCPSSISGLRADRSTAHLLDEACSTSSSLGANRPSTKAPRRRLSVQGLSSVPAEELKSIAITQSGHLTLASTGATSAIGTRQNVPRGLA